MSEAVTELPEIQPRKEFSDPRLHKHPRMTVVVDKSFVDQIPRDANQSGVVTLQSEKQADVTGAEAAELAVLFASVAWNFSKPALGSSRSFGLHAVGLDEQPIPKDQKHSPDITRLWRASFRVNGV